MLKSVVAESYHDSPVENKNGKSNTPMGPKTIYIMPLYGPVKIWPQAAGRRPQAAGRRPQATGHRPQLARGPYFGHAWSIANLSSFLTGTLWANDKEVELAALADLCARSERFIGTMGWWDGPSH